MKNEKLNSKMSPIDIVMTMGEGNPGAMSVVMQMLKDTDGFMNLLFFDTNDIRGSKIYMLYNDCCGNNYDKFKRTIDMLRCGTFTQEQIHSNLELVNAIPFIDDSVVVDGVPAYGEDEFDPTNLEWDLYAEKNKEVFLPKLEAALEEQRSGPSM